MKYLIVLPALVMLMVEQAMVKRIARRLMRG
jgi:hypothetical protein